MHFLACYKYLEHVYDTFIGTFMTRIPRYAYLGIGVIMGSVIKSARITVSIPLLVASVSVSIAYIVALNCCHTRVASSRSPHGVHEKCRTLRCTPYGLLERRSISVASPLDAVGSPRSPCDGVHFVHAQSTRRGTAL